VEHDAFPYRRHVDLDDFFARIDGVPAWDNEGSRHTKTVQFLGACNRTPLGESRLPQGIEAVVKAMLNVGEFEDAPERDAALVLVHEIMEGYHVLIETDFDGEVQIVSTASNKRQQLIDAELHTAFGNVLHESDLNTARVHYANAQRMIRGGDFPNAAKEAVCSVEACLSTITGEDDLKKALRKATQAGLPQPLDGVIEKLYAWRGNEPGVAHGGKELPAVTRADAQFALNMAAAVNLYLRERLLGDGDD
jgi:hypothetical protein